MSRSSHVIFDGYSYEPPSYEEAQATAAASQSVYKPTVSQSQDTNFGGFRPLYTPNGSNGLTEYNSAKRRRRMRIAVATVLGIFGIIILIAVLIRNINTAYHGAHKYQSYADKSDEDRTPYQDSSIYNNNNYYPESVNGNKPIQDSDDDVLDKTETKVNVENHNDPFTNNGGFYGGYDWEKESQKTLEKLQSEDYGLHSSNTKDEKESPTDYNIPLIDDEFLRKEMEKWNLKLKDNSAIIDEKKETSADKNSGNHHDSVNPYDLNSIVKQYLEKLKNGENADNTGGYNFLDSLTKEEMEKLNLNPAIITPRNPTATPDKTKIDDEKQTSADKNSGNHHDSVNPYNLNSIVLKELEKLKTGEDADNTGGYDFLDSYIRKGLEKLNSNPVIITPTNPTATPDKTNINTSTTGKSTDEDVKIPDLLTSHTGDIDINKIHELLFSKYLKEDNNDNH